jgi:NAD(P)-dependent dehydrogenase (short-subunit alcohol dehydrogenase family)
MSATDAQPKSVVITGCSRGLGRALVDRFEEGGWLVSGCARDAQALGELRQLHPGGFFCPADTSDAAAMDQFAAEAIQRFGPPDILLCNAAVISPNAPLWETAPADFARVMQVNLGGVFHTIRSFLPAMIAAGRGLVVNFSSGWGRSTSPEVAPYCASKWGIEGLTQALAQELPPGLSAVALNPGIIDTDMLRSCFGEGAGGYPDAEAWSRQAFRCLLQLRQSDNGRSLTVV